MDVEIGQLLDNKYRIVRLLGQGGMGAVYEGTNVRIHHRVAIKVLHPGIANDVAAVERFEREAQAAGKIGSDHIVEVFDLGELPSGARYMVMEFLEGENLSARIERSGRLPPEHAAPIMLQMLEGLGAAHAAGIVHRDLKPDNIFLQRTKADPSFVKIVDFGVSKFNSMGGGSGSMTRTGSVVGTPYYMSPEQLKGSKYTDHRSDLYSAGVVLFETITGAVPFQADTFNELMFKIVFEEPLDPEAVAPGLDHSFAQIVRTAMARDPAARFQSAADFAQAIISWMNALGHSVAAASVFAGMPAPRAPMQTDPGAAARAGMANTPNPLSRQTTPNPSLHGHRTTPDPSLLSSNPSTITAPRHTPGSQAFSAAVGPSPNGTLAAPGVASSNSQLTKSAGSGVNLVAPNSTSRRAPVPTVWLAAGGLVVLLVAGGSAMMLQHKSGPSAEGAATSAQNSASGAPIRATEPSATPPPPPTVTLATPQPPPPAASETAEPEEEKPTVSGHEAHAAAQHHVGGAAAGHHAAASTSAAPTASAAPAASDTATLKGRTVHTQL